MSPIGLEAHKRIMKDVGGGRYLETGPLTPTYVFTSAVCALK